MPYPTNEWEKLDEEIKEKILDELDTETKDKLENGEIDISDIDVSDIDVFDIDA